MVGFVYSLDLGAPSGPFTERNNVPCYHPVSAYRTSEGVFFKEVADSSLIRLPCGRCIGCRLERSRQWALRLTHENRFHDKSAFITLTYDEDHLPKDGSLNLKHFQDFMKRLRKFKKYTKLRFFMQENMVSSEAGRITTQLYSVRIFAQVDLTWRFLLVVTRPGHRPISIDCGPAESTAWAKSLLSHVHMWLDM